MKIQSILAGALALALVSATAPDAATACEGMGDNVHAGVVKSVGDTSFVLVDASSGSPLTFDAGLETLTVLQTGEHVKVQYATDEKGRLHALRVGK
jgi:hypothetical protein